MIRSLSLHQFKNFRDATLHLGPFTVLIGANASGKSNIRDAFRFLHGIGRGYSVAEILGEKYVGGERIWSGIRGGTREVAYSGSNSFEVYIDLDVEFLGFVPRNTAQFNYLIEIEPSGPNARPPKVLHESLGFREVDVFVDTKEIDDKDRRVNNFPKS